MHDETTNGSGDDVTDPDVPSPGVVVTRRRMVELAGLTLLGGVGCAGRSGSVEFSTSAALTLEQFVERVRVRAKEMIASDLPDESSYLTAVSMLLDRYRPETPWAMPQVGETGRSSNPAAIMPPVLVWDIQMSPGATIPIHDHRHYNGVLLCTEGSVRCRNFDIVQPDKALLDIASGEVPSGDFLIRQTRDVTLQPGQCSTLSRDRDNIHHIVAGPEGCTLIDVFTYFRREARSYGLEWDEQPLSPGGDVYQVRWRS